MVGRAYQTLVGSEPASIGLVSGLSCELPVPAEFAVRISCQAYFITCLFIATAGFAGVAEAAAGEPTVDIIQAAYEREAQRGDARHDKNLRIRTVECSKGQIKHEYLCWISFTSNADQTAAISFDVATVEETGDGWALKSGLCRK
jgi:hypothetical protein